LYYDVGFVKEYNPNNPQYSINSTSCTNSQHDEEFKASKKEYQIQDMSYDPITGEKIARALDKSTNRVVTIRIIDDRTALIDDKQFTMDTTPLQQLFMQSEYQHAKVLKKESEADEVLKMSKAVYLSELAAEMLPEPDVGEKGVVELMLIFPNGRLLNRRFYERQKVEDIINLCKIEMNTVDDIELSGLNSNSVLRSKEDMICKFAKRENTLCVKCLL